MLGGTDCQHFVPVCDNIYRFTSLVMDPSFMGLEHGIDERIPVEAMGKMVKFYAQLMQVVLRYDDSAIERRQTWPKIKGRRKARR